MRKIEEQNRRFSEQGLRVLAFAYKEPEPGEKLTLENEKDFVFIGLAAMIDPPREEAKDAVAAAKRAGIRPVMITGHLRGGRYRHGGNGVRLHQR